MITPILELAERVPGIIFQLTAADLVAFAQSLTKKEELLTIAEVCAMLKVSKMTLNRWHQSGILRKVDVGGQRRYCRTDVEALIAKGGDQ